MSYPLHGIFRKWYHHKKYGDDQPVDIVCLPQVGKYQTGSQHKDLTQCKSKPQITDIRFADAEIQPPVIGGRFNFLELRIKFFINTPCRLLVVILLCVIRQIVYNLEYKDKAAVPVGFPF